MEVRGSWEPVVTADGSLTFASPKHGQLCHSKEGAWTESLERYAQPCRIAERCVEFASEGRPLRLLDVGTGAGWNFAAAWLALDRARRSNPDAALEIWTLEEAVEVLRASLTEPDPAAGLDAEAAAYHERWRQVLSEFANSGLGEGDLRCADRPGLTIRLLLGDARETLLKIPAEILFDACFFDAFSPGVDPPLWEADFLHAVGERLAPGAILSTYTASLEVRARLHHSAKLQVGVGPRVCGKSQGTLAVRPPGPPPPPLTPRTARKLRARIRRNSVEI